jgi:hypothetical protein
MLAFLIPESVRRSFITPFRAQSVTVADDPIADGRQ